MLPKIILPIAFAVAVGLALGFMAARSTPSSADSPSSGIIVGRVFEPGPPEYKWPQLTVLPGNGANAYVVFVNPVCFDAVHNGDPWPNALAACK